MNNVKHAFLCISSNLVYLTLSKVPFFPFCFIKYPRFWFKIHFLAWNILLYSITSLSNYITKSNKNQGESLVYHQFRKKLYIIRSKSGISSLRKRYNLRLMIYAYGDDIPNLRFGLLSRRKPCISSISQEIAYHPLEEWHIIIAKAIQPTVDDIRLRRWYTR